jgi:hypothetical protein
MAAARPRGTPFPKPQLSTSDFLRAKVVVVVVVVEVQHVCPRHAG